MRRVVDVLEFWLIANRFVGDSGLVATLVDVHALVVRQVFAARPLGASHALEHLPLGVVARFNSRLISVRVEFVRTVAELVEVDGLVLLRIDAVGELGQHDQRIAFLEAAEDLSRCVTETLGEPVHDVGAERRIVATVGGFTLFLVDQVVDIVSLVIVEHVRLGLGVLEARLTWQRSVLFFRPGRAPLSFVQSGRVFPVTPWVFTVTRRLVTTLNVVQTFLWTAASSAWRTSKLSRTT